MGIGPSLYAWPMSSLFIHQTLLSYWPAGHQLVQMVEIDVLDL